MSISGCCGHFFLFLTIDFLDVLGDFIFYAQLEGLKKLLIRERVPESCAVSYAVLTFAIVGFFIFITQTVVSALKTFKGKEIDLYVDLLSAIGIWCADLPQITLNVYVAACQKELVSNVQIIKGVVILVAVFISFLILLILSIVAKHKHCAIRTLGLIGALTISIIAIFLSCVFILHHLKDGKLVRTKSYRYFETVGDFVNQKFLFPGRIIRSHRDERNKCVRFSDRGHMTQKQNLLGKECYRPNLTRLNNDDSFVESHELLVSTCLNLHTSENTAVFVFRFHFIKPIHGFFNNSKIFGDISLIVKPDIMGPNVTSTRGQRELTDIPVNPVRYFRYFSNSGNLVHQTSLTDIKDVWRTGYYQCESTGNLYPTRDTTLKIDTGDL
ncbi:uncharacterized protein LOC135481668 [Liolophura sinensis]|uniref:uncharacterized protein LOC135481668 n=1 Tax=Liolophura sinensis TaxID=3198878 RepID=UPI003158DEEB